MKILTVVANLMKGGTQRAAQNFLEAYHALGHDSRMLAMYAGGPRLDELAAAGINVWVTLSAGLEEIIAWRPEVIHLHSHGLKVPELEKLKSLLPKARLFETNVFSIPSPIERDLSLSFQLSSWCQFRYHCLRGDAAKSIVIPNPVKTSTMFRADAGEIESFKKLHRIPPGDFVIGRIGQAFTRKWSPALLALFERFLDEVNPAAHLLLCNPSSDILALLAGSPRLQNHTTVIDSIFGDDQLRLFYGAMDVMVHIANVGESFGMVLAEALLCETPVLTLNTPWADNTQGEVIAGQGTGMTANDIEGLYQCLVALHGDAKRRSLAGQLGRRHVLDQYDMLSVAKRAVVAMEEPAFPPPLNLRDIYRYTSNDVLARMLIRTMYLLRSVRVGNWTGQVFLWRAGFSAGDRKAISRM